MFFNTLIKGNLGSMKTVLITGSNGLLGQKITALILAKKPMRLVATNRGTNKYPIKEGYVYEEMDLLARKRVAEVLRQYRPEVVIHAAAMTNADICHDQPEECWKVNVEATGYLVSLCEEMGTHFIYVSTDFIFDGKSGPYKEDDRPHPLSVYGHSKLAAEQIVRGMKGSWAIVRTILVYGVLSNMSRSNIVLWAKKSLEEGKPIKVVNDQWRMPTLAEDLAEGCLQIAQERAEGIYHLSGKDMMSVVEMVRQVADAWQLDKSLIEEINSADLRQKAARPKKTGFVLDKAMTKLNYKPHSFEEGLEMVREQLTP